MTLKSHEEIIIIFNKILILKKINKNCLFFSLNRIF